MVQAAAALGRAVRAEDGIGEAVRRLRAWNLLPADTSHPSGYRVVRSTA
jgi:hypothetical protein